MASRDAGEPVISVDTKKKELVGEFKNSGRELRPAGDPLRVSTHDFVIPELGRAAPYGVYDIADNSAWVRVGTDADTASFAVESIRRWWEKMGRPRYPTATKLTITADCGGSSGYRTRLWKLELQRDVASRHVAGFGDLADAYLGPRDDIATMSRGQVAALVEAGTITILDVRPRAEFEAGHIPSAVSIDPERLYDELRKIPRTPEVVAYCRGPYCAYACEAVRALKANGVQASRLEEGFPEWRRAGLPVALATGAENNTAAGTVRQSRA